MLGIDESPRPGYTFNVVPTLIALFGIALFIVFLTVSAGIERTAIASIPNTPEPEATPIDCSEEKARVDEWKAKYEKAKQEYDEKLKEAEEAQTELDEILPVIKEMEGDFKKLIIKIREQEAQIQESKNTIKKGEIEIAAAIAASLNSTYEDWGQSQEDGDDNDYGRVPLSPYESPAFNPAIQEWCQKVVQHWEKKIEEETSKLIEYNKNLEKLVGERIELGGDLSVYRKVRRQLEEIVRLFEVSEEELLFNIDYGKDKLAEAEKAYDECMETKK